MKKMSVTKNIIIPEKAEELMLLAELVIAKHLHEGTNSPIKMSYIAELNYKLKNAKYQHSEGMKFYKAAKAAFLERDLALGMGNDDKIADNSAGTLKHLLGMIVEILSESDEGKGQSLKEWGFEKKRSARASRT